MRPNSRKRRRNIGTPGGKVDRAVPPCAEFGEEMS
jgi:hypothetical protein